VHDERSRKDWNKVDGRDDLALIFALGSSGFTRFWPMTAGN